MREGSRVVVRPAESRDAAVVGLLVGDLAGDAVGPSDAARRLKALREDPAQVVLVGEFRGAIVGWCHVMTATRLQVPPFAEVAGIVVASSEQRGGVGRALLAAAEEWARARGLAEMRIRTRVERAGAHAFYAARGYEARKDQTVFVRALH